MNKEYLDKFLKEYSKILLYIFMICLSIPLILYIINPSMYIHQTTTHSYTYEYDYDVITLQEELAMKKKITKYMLIGTICIGGMIISNPDSRKKITSLIKKVDKI